jgi:hypothetical protein
MSKTVPENLRKKPIKHKGKEKRGLSANTLQSAELILFSSVLHINKPLKKEAISIVFCLLYSYTMCRLAKV